MISDDSQNLFDCYNSSFFHNVEDKLYTELYYKFQDILIESFDINRLTYLLNELMMIYALNEANINYFKGQNQTLKMKEKYLNEYLSITCMSGNGSMEDLKLTYEKYRDTCILYEYTHQILSIETVNIHYFFKRIQDAINRIKNDIIIDIKMFNTIDNHIINKDQLNPFFEIFNSNNNFEKITKLDKYKVLFNTNIEFNNFIYLKEYFTIEDYNLKTEKNKYNQIYRYFFKNDEHNQVLYKELIKDISGFDYGKTKITNATLKHQNSIKNLLKIKKQESESK
ncbi:hypothetical protein [Empedobacter falsenii]|uniref:hypothetical protein n=1 Tax=Empedobacter falsenii TaxID=343874 RepID=UPI003A802B63